MLSQKISNQEIARLKRKIEDIRAKELASRPQMRSKHPLDEPKEREYDPNQTESRDLSILDVQQMFGRAGRPQRVEHRLLPQH